MVWLYAVPTVPFGNAERAMGSHTVIEYECTPVQPMLSVAVTSKLNVPTGGVTVPLISPVLEFKDKPPGNEPLERVYV
jgi:hypothetical protein